jgi:hypothetical protein
MDFRKVHDAFTDTARELRKTIYRPNDPDHHWDVAYQRFPEYRDLEKARDDAVDKCGAIEEAILSLQARTIEGLAVKALVVAQEHSRLWDVAEQDLDWDERHVRALVDNLAALAGVKVPALPVRFG